LKLIDAERFMEMANKDPEFKIAARYWNTTLKLEAGNSIFMVRIENGRISGIDSNPGLMEDWDFDFFIRAPENEWEMLLAPVPEPFYQALVPAVMLHGFDHGGDFESFCAYYRALSRMIEIMRLCRPAAA